MPGGFNVWKVLFTQYFGSGQQPCGRRFTFGRFSIFQGVFAMFFIIVFWHHEASRWSSHWGLYHRSIHLLCARISRKSATKQQENYWWIRELIQCFIDFECVFLWNKLNKFEKCILKFCSWKYVQSVNVSQRLVFERICIQKIQIKCRSLTFLVRCDRPKSPRIKSMWQCSLKSKYCAHSHVFLDFY